MFSASCLFSMPELRGNRVKDTSGNATVSEERALITTDEVIHWEGKVSCDPQARRPASWGTASEKRRQHVLPFFYKHESGTEISDFV